MEEVARLGWWMARGGGEAGAAAAGGEEGSSEGSSGGGGAGVGAARVGVFGEGGCHKGEVHVVQLQRV